MTSACDRRGLIHAATGLFVAAGPLVPATSAPAQGVGAQKGKMAGVTPPEDLMREHGVLNRILLIYEAALRRFSRNEAIDPALIAQAAQIVRQFIEGYHERNEEQQVFPRFRQAGKMTALVDVLYQQHQAGRRRTDNILRLAPGSRTAGEDRRRLIGNLRAFIAMYRPHEAREDTELFPQLRSVVSANEFDSMAEDFERDETRKFGRDGFETMVGRVASIEKAIGINDLAAFTPQP
jgi:hemerythrin-like domain-containing protein